jgi:uncharacterized membrane protein YeaQ/YmgE (transglycosylase-associated protein family)
MGALLGGVIFLIFDTAPLSAIKLEGLLFALIGAIVVIALVRLLFLRPI